MRFGKSKISAKLIKLISNRFFNIEESLFKLVMYMIDFETGGLGSTSIKVKEKLEDGTIQEKVLSTREEFLEVIYLPLHKFEEKYVGLVDEAGNEHDNAELINYRNKAHSKYERMASRVVAVSLLSFGIGVFSNWVSNFIPT